MRDIKRQKAPLSYYIHQHANRNQSLKMCPQEVGDDILKPSNLYLYLYVQYVESICCVSITY